MRLLQLLRPPQRQRQRRGRRLSSRRKSRSRFLFRFPFSLQLRPPLRFQLYQSQYLPQPKFDSRRQRDRKSKFRSRRQLFLNQSLLLMRHFERRRPLQARPAYKTSYLMNRLNHLHLFLWKDKPLPRVVEDTIQYATGIGLPSLRQLYRRLSNLVSTHSRHQMQCKPPILPYTRNLLLLSVP